MAVLYYKDKAGYNKIPFFASGGESGSTVVVMLDDFTNIENVTFTAVQGEHAESGALSPSQPSAAAHGFTDNTPIVVTLNYTLNGVEASLEEVVDNKYFGKYDVIFSAGLNPLTWQRYGRCSTTYTTLDEILADEKCIRQLMTVHNSVNYLRDICVIDPIAARKILNNDLCAKWINLRDYALDTLYAKSEAKAIMDSVDKYGYGEWALMPQVPTMTSATAPYGKVTASVSDYNGRPEWKAFDGLTNTIWLANQITPVGGSNSAWIQYEFTKPTRISGLTVVENDDWTTVGLRITDYTLSCSNDGINFIDIHSVSDVSVVGINDTFINDISALYWRFNMTVKNDTTGTQPLPGIRNLQFYAWEPKGAVPVMTSNTAPYGEAFANNNHTNTPPWKVFDRLLYSLSDRYASTNGQKGCWLGYKFVNPVCARRFDVVEWVSLQDGTHHDTNIFIEGSLDGNTWELLSTNTLYASERYKRQTFDFNNDNYYLYYRLRFETYNVSANSTTYCILGELQFYGRQLKVSVPAMTSNTAPYGEVIASSSQSSTAYYVFSYSGKNWDTGESGAKPVVGYKFTKPTKILSAYIVNASEGVRNTKLTSIEASNDNINWVTLKEFDNLNVNSIYSELDNDEHYLYYRVVGNPSSSYAAGYNKIQFYGVDYSEREFEQDSNIKYLYDHGVELESINYFKSNSDISASKDDTIYISRQTGSATIVSAYVTIDASKYNKVRAVAGNILTTDKDVARNISMGSSASPLNTTSISWSAYSTSTDLPYHAYLDISAINNTAENIGVYFADASTKKEMTVTEWWLE